MTNNKFKAIFLVLGLVLFLTNSYCKAAEVNGTNASTNSKFDSSAAFKSNSSTKNTEIALVNTVSSTVKKLENTCKNSQDIEDKENKQAAEPVVKNPVSHTNNAATQKTASAKTANAKPRVYAKKASYKVYNDPQNNKIATIYVMNKEVAKYTQEAGGYSAEQRAKILVDKLNYFLTREGGSAKDILPGIEGGIPVGRIKDKVLFTADSSTAKELNISRNQLAITWVNNIREALGAPKISRDFARVASRSGLSLDLARSKATVKEAGIASWYGGKFHGRKAADGSIYNKYNFTAAHKTLPLGTFVKVTNVGNQKSCIVQITDRGPFVQGRVIDLSLEAAKQLEMIQSGVSNVTLQVIDRF